MSLLRINILTEGHSQFRPAIELAGIEVWKDQDTYVSSEDALQAAEVKAAGAFTELFQLIDSPAHYNPALEVLETLDPKWLEGEALERETFGGKTFTENILDIIKERISAA